MYRLFFLTIIAFNLPLCSSAGTNQVGSDLHAPKPASHVDPKAGQTGTNALALQAEQLRMSCIEGRRYICGRVMQILPDGLVVDSGYSALLSPPFNQSWLVRGNVSVAKSPALVEEKKPDAMCVGLVFLTDVPKRPPVRNFDYVVIHGYPAGEHSYAPVPNVQKKLRRFSASLERAVSANLVAGEK